MAGSSRIVICGAGIAGAAAAYHLAVKHGCADVTIIEQGYPLSLTSDKSTEAYRNWWPGPRSGHDRLHEAGLATAAVAAALLAHIAPSAAQPPARSADAAAEAPASLPGNRLGAVLDARPARSIDLIEEIARATRNRVNLNRRGYVFTTADAAKIPFLQAMAMKAEAQGSGPARIHETASSRYVPAPEHGFDLPLTGADVITDATLVRQHFPYLAPETVAVAHARRAGVARSALGLPRSATVRVRNPCASALALSHHGGRLPACGRRLSADRDGIGSCRAAVADHLHLPANYRRFRLKAGAAATERCRARSARGSLRGAKRRSNPDAPPAFWIASPSARNDNALSRAKQLTAAAATLPSC